MTSTLSADDGDVMLSGAADLLYNDLPDLVEASSSLPVLERSVIPALARLLANYNLHTQFNICLVHKHFSLLDDTEQVVDLDGSSGSISSVFRSGCANPRIIEHFSLNLPVAPSIVPDTFLVDDSGLIPYEFCCREIEEAEKHNRLTNNVDQAFLGAWQKVLVDNNVTKRVGLLLRKGGEGMSKEKITRETSDSTVRVHFTVDSTADEFVGARNAGHGIPTIWEVYTEENAAARQFVVPGGVISADPLTAPPAIGTLLGIHVVCVECAKG